MEEGLVSPAHQCPADFALPAARSTKAAPDLREVVWSVCVWVCSVAACVAHCVAMVSTRWRMFFALCRAWWHR